LSGDYTLAQITPDGTLGAESSVVTPNLIIKDLPGDRLDGGALRGANLFHSFTDFNVKESQRVYFANPVGVSNILSRVTGKNPSDILGTLGVLGNANLFLINPNGIYFGPNARLDIRGSFTATTSEGIQLGENGLFSATDPQNSQLLSVQPSALFTNAMAQHQAAIRNEGNLAAGENLTLAASNLDLQGQLYARANLTLQALDTVRIRDSANTPFVAAASNQLLVQGNQGVDIFALNHPYSGLFSGGKMILRSANPVGGDAHYWSGGSFRIEQLDGSLGNLLSLYDPIIRSQGDVSFFGYEGTSLNILAGGSVNIGAVFITGTDVTGDTINQTSTPTLANVTLSDGTALVIDGSARPTLDVRAGMKPEAIGSPLGTSGDNFPTDVFFDASFFIEPPPANNPVATNADITIGYIQINPPNGIVLLTNQYEPNLSLPSGDIHLPATGISGFRGINLSVSGDDGGDAILDSRGNISLDNTIIFSSGSTAGDVTLLARDDITLNPGSGIFANAFRRFAGDVNALGGDVKLVSGGDVSINQARLDVRASDGGSITIDAQNIKIFDSLLLTGIRGDFGGMETR
jgi:filamentous hemagglutinin family protein